jgi:hypothetical protein
MAASQVWTDWNVYESRSKNDARYLPIGAYGLGAASSIVSTDADVAAPNQFFSWGANTNGAPTPQAFFGIEGADSGSRWQLAWIRGTATTDLATRVRSPSGVWSATWSKIWHSTNATVDENGFLKSSSATGGSALVRSDFPVGIPQPWPTNTAPVGWLKCNGATFDKAKYPLLATAYPSGKLPDLRGEFIRGWDDGRGVDNGRALLSAQVGSKLRQCASTTTPSAGNGANIWDNLEFDQPQTMTLYSTTTNPTGEPFSTGIVRPRNVAFNYIVRAA